MVLNTFVIYEYIYNIFIKIITKMKKVLFFNLVLFFSTLAFGQKSLLESGPMVGYSEMREVQLWVQTKSIANVQIAYWEQNVENPDTFQTEKIQTNKMQTVNFGKKFPGYQDQAFLTGSKVSSTSIIINILFPVK